MSPLKAISTCYKKYATFSGRATRSELWYFLLYVGIIIGLAATLVVITSHNELLLKPSVAIEVLLLLTHLLPYVAVCVRRLHDINKSGWWLLIYFIPGGFLVLIIFFSRKGMPNTNRFGEPKLLQ